MKRVLICDDDEAIVDVCKIILEEAGHEVQGLADGDKIKKKIKEYRPHLILLDLWMPGAGGEEITKQLKKGKSTRKIPVIIISAHPQTEKRALSAGADGFICKPFDVDYFEKMVAKFIS